MNRNSRRFIVQSDKIISADYSGVYIFDGVEKNKICDNYYYTSFGMHKNILYFFHSTDVFKYDYIAKKETLFRVRYLLGLCKYVNNKFYFFDNGKYEGIFDPEDDIFYESDILDEGSQFAHRSI